MRSSRRSGARGVHRQQHRERAGGLDRLHVGVRDQVRGLVPEGPAPLANAQIPITGGVRRRPTLTRDVAACKGLAASHLPGGTRVGPAESTVQVLEPATEEVMAELPKAGPDEADAAIARAKAAFPAWRGRPGGPGRSCCAGCRPLSAGARRGARAARGRATWASRSPTPAARWGWLPTSSTTTRARPSACSGDTIPVAGGVDLTFREPLGVVGLITPVELPARDRLVEARSGAGGRQHGGAQAGRADAAHRGRARAHRVRRPASPRVY